MRYFLRSGALYIRGALTAVTSGAQYSGREGSTIPISTIIAAHIPKTNIKESNDSFLNNIREKCNSETGTETAILPVTVPTDRLCIFAYDGVIVFILADSANTSGEHPGNGTIIVCCREPVQETGLIELLDTAKEAIRQAFVTAGYPADASGRNSVLICCEKTEESPDVHERLTRAKALVSETIAYGIPETLAFSEIKNGRLPPFYIHSSIGGERWTRWDPDNCPYYPCHPSCQGQRCDFCYCPLYPCGDESQGKWLERENGGRIWSCEGCTLVHEPHVAEYLIQNPEASLEELKMIRIKGKNSE